MRPKTQLLLEKVMSSFPNELVSYTLEWNISWPRRIDATAHVSSPSLTLSKNNFHCVARQIFFKLLFYVFSFIYVYSVDFIVDRIIDLKTANT